MRSRLLRLMFGRDRSGGRPSKPSWLTNFFWARRALFQYCFSLSGVLGNGFRVVCSGTSGRSEVCVNETFLTQDVFYP